MTCNDGPGCRSDDLLDGGLVPHGGSVLVPLPNAEKLGCGRAFEAHMADATTLRVDGVNVCTGTLHVRFAAVGD